jgi:hypothetical protein
VRKQLRETIQADTGDERWMDPFALALGIRDSEFAGWRDTFFTKSPALVLVEGEIDKRYLDLLRDPAHGEDSLRFEGDIFPYGGRDALKNQALLRFIRDNGMCQ